MVLEYHILADVLRVQKFQHKPTDELSCGLSKRKPFWRHWRRPTGLFLAVLGPDGSGKSTLIERLPEKSNGVFHRSEVFHLMPGLLRDRPDVGPVTEPHGKPPRSRPASLVKLLYYLLDYNLGYWIKVRPALARSTLVLFDRYYDDLLIDPRRYRYGGPVGLACWLRRFIPRPDLFLVLDVPVEKLLERKQEVAPEELRRQREAYRRFAIETPNAFLLDGSLPPEEVTREAREIILDHLHARYLSRRHIWFPRNRREELAWLEEALGIAVTDKGRPTHAWLRLPDGRGYFLPLNNARVFRRGLELYPAQGRKARLGKTALGALAGLGMKGPGLLRVGLEERDGSVLQTLREVFRRDDLCFAVSLGTPGPHRKPVIQVLTPEGKVLGYAKVGWNEATKALVEHEAEVLKRLSGEDLPFGVPRMFYANESEGRSLCVQAPPPDGSRPAPGKWTSAYTDVLCALASRGVVRRPLEETDFWRRIVARVEEVQHPYWKRLLKEAVEKVRREWEGKEVPLHPAHGDFAPWNAFWADGRLYLYDWEYAMEDAPAGYDLFHFAIRTLWLVEGFTLAEVAREVSERGWKPCASAYWKQVGISTYETEALLRLYLLDQTMLVLDGQTHIGGAYANTFARLSLV